ERCQIGCAQGVDCLTHPNLAGLRLTSPPTYWRCEPGWSWRARPLPDFLLWYVLDGVGRLAVGDRNVALAAGTAVVFAPGEAPGAVHPPVHRVRRYAAGPVPDPGADRSGAPVAERDGHGGRHGGGGSGVFRRRVLQPAVQAIHRRAAQRPPGRPAGAAARRLGP